ncbi:putative zinc finger protein [Schistosoma mansoni]|uniref:putative zinc finger protein n=1 Tax=Schistosoma mansoni TaxID=6183 RepID=UPI00022DC50A|nr:putative zinc finger protein [Schistosoma mansoni]|eukprot:XP_018653829.1 putative zinc finger protein [Schistosoma mansoni]
MNKHKQIPDHFNTVKRDNIEDVKQTSMELNEERLSVVGAKTLTCQWKSCRLKSFVNHIESSHVSSHISNKEYCCYWEGCRQMLIYLVMSSTNAISYSVIYSSELGACNYWLILPHHNMNYSQNYYPENNTDSYGIYGSFNDTIPSYCIQNNLKLSNRNCTNIQSSNMTKITNDFPCSYISSYQSTVNGNSPSQWNPSLDQFNSYEIDHTSRLKYHWNEDSSYTHHNHQHIK